jgi:hypothetical protein
MMQEEIHKRLHARELGPCACSQVRKLARKLSSHYDTSLPPEDFTITQYSLLANIELAGQLSHTVLAEKVGMERTTLTRNLRPRWNRRYRSRNFQSLENGATVVISDINPEQGKRLRKSWGWNSSLW